jgi:DNA repair protein RadC
MSDHLIAITDLAREIRLRKPTLKWTDAVKMASQQLGGSSVGGRKSKATIYVRSSKTKTGKTRLKVHARAKGVRKKTTAKALPLSNKYTPKTYDQFLQSGMQTKLPIGPSFKPLPKSRTPRKTTPNMELMSPVKVTKKSITKQREPGLYRTDLLKNTPKQRVIPKQSKQDFNDALNKYFEKPVKVKKEKGVYRMPTGGNVEDYPRMKVETYQNIYKTLFYTNDYKLAIKEYKKGNSVFALPVDQKKYRGSYYMLNESEITPLTASRYVDGRYMQINPNPLWDKYLVSRLLTFGEKQSMSKNVAGISYVKGKPMLSLSGVKYPTQAERIFIGSTATICKKVKDKQKKIGDLQAVYSIPEIKVEVVGTKAVKDTPALRNSSMVASAIRRYIDAKYPGLRATQEIFGVLLLNNQNRVMGIYITGIGTRNSVTVDMGYILSAVAKISPKCIVLTHNHPSGQTQPSKPDENLTADVKKGICQPLGIQLLDHIILSGVDDEYFSFAESGYL